MNLKTLLQSINFTLGASWIYVDNQTTSGGIQFVEGTKVWTTVSGLSNIMSGTPRTFQIDMPSVGNNYATSRQVSNWSFGPSGFAKALQTSESDATPLGTFTIEEGKMYTITVSGDFNANTLKAWISSTTDIPSSEIGGTW
jgi:hypothetical protein